MSDYTNIEGLVIEVEADASSASRELEWLTARIEQFKSAVGKSSSLTTFSKNLDKLTLSLSNLSYFKDTLTSFTSFATGVSVLSNLNIKAGIATNISNLAEASKQFTPESISQLGQVVNALTGLSAINGLKISSTIPKYLETIAEATRKMDGIDFSKLRELTEALAPLAQVAVADGEGMRNLAAAVKTFSSVAHTGAKRGRTFNTVLANIRVKTLAIITAFRKVVNVVLGGLETYGDYIETLNLFSVSMGEASEQAYEYAVQVQDALGIDLTQWMKSQGVFQTLAKGFGIATDRATIMSQQLTQLAYDISSFYNISVADAVQKVQSAFSGELEPVRRLGFDLSQAKLQAIALSLGIDENVKSMDQAEKASLRYYALLTQVTDAQGDLARTLSSPTNQLRIFNAQITQLSRSVGQLFIPILNKVLPYLNAMVQVLKWIIDEIAALFGYTLPGVDFGGVGSGVADGVGEVGDALDDATGKAEKLKNTLASFDEINLIGSSSGGGSGSGDSIDLGSGFDFDLPQYDFLGEATENRAKAIADSIKKNIAPAVESIKTAIMFIRDNWDAILTTTKVLIATIAAVKLASWLSNVVNMLKEINTKALGISLAIAGITLAFSGGQAIADGNYLAGFIQAGLGVALGTIGGALAFGPAGAVIGFSVSLVAALIGFKIENDKQIKAQADAIFYAYDTTKLSMDEFVGSFKNFADTLTGNWEAVVEAYGQMSQAKLDFKDNLTSMDALIQAFRDGKISAEEFASGMNTVFEGLGTALTGYLEGAQNVIKTELSGALGAYLTEAGWTVAEMQTMMDTAQGNYMKALETEESYIKSLETAYNNGYITVDQYKDGLAQAQEKIQQITAAAARGTESAVDFNTALNKGVNLEKLDETMQGITELQTIYDDAFTKIEDRRSKLVEAMRVMRDDPLADQATKQRWQKAIDDTNAYFEEQKSMLTKGYADALDVIAAETSDAWMDVYESMGAEVAFTRLNEDVTTIADALQKAYKDADIKGVRESTLADLLKLRDDMNEALYLGDDNAFVQWIAEFQKWKGYVDSPEIRDALGKMFQNYVDGAKDATESTKALNHDLETIRADIENKFTDVINREGGIEQMSNYLSGLMDAYPQFADDILGYKMLLEETLGVDLGDIGKATVDTFSDGIEEETEKKLLPTLQIIPDKMGSNYAAMIDPEFYSATTNTIMTAIVDSLEDDTGIVTASSNIVSTIVGILDDPEKKIETASAGIGTEIHDGLNGKTNDITGVIGDWITNIGQTFKNDTTTKNEAEGFVNTIQSSMNAKTNMFKDVGDTIRSTIIMAANAVGATSFTSFGGDVINTIGESITNNKSKLNTSAKGIVTGLVDYLNAGLADIQKYGDGVIENVSDGISKSTRSNDLKKAVSGIGDTIYGDLVQSYSAMTDYGYNVGIKVAEGLENNGATGRVASASRNMKNTVEKEFDDMSKDIEKTVNDMLKKLSNAFNNFKITGSFNTSTSNLNTANIPGYANGGFPAKADLFFANEDGVPEYIGSMGGKTAVANNTEIIKGVSEGVYRAIKDTGIAQDVKVLTKKQNTTVFAPSKEAGRVMAISTNMYNGVGGRYQ